ncbi:MAG: BatD family protein [Dysgonomonas sp.]|nr:BatD family protein [Dysgonomonas sp.]
MSIGRKSLTVFIVTLIFGLDITNAKEIKFEVEAPSEIIQGQEFRVVYSLQNGEPNNVNLPQIASDFEIIQGPALSTYSETEIVDDVRVINHSRTYTYILVSNKTGKMKLPVASLFVDGKLYRTKAKTINVINWGEANKKSQKKQKSNKDIHKINEDDIFIRTIVEKTDLGGQEAYEVTFRLYTRLDIKRVEKAKYPEFISFDVFDEWKPSRQPMVTENYKGNEYYAADMRKVILIPLTPGKKLIQGGNVVFTLKIPTGEIEQTYFGSEEKIIEVRKTVPIEPFSIDAGVPANTKLAYLAD